MAASSLATPLPMSRNHSVATSHPYYLEHHKGSTRSYFSSSSLSSSRNSWLYYIPALLLMIAPWLSPHNIKENIQQYQTDIRALQEKQQEMVKQLDTMTSSIQDYNTKIHALNKKNGQQFQELRQNAGMFTQLSLDTQEYVEVEKIEEGLIRRLDDLEKHIQRTSAKMAIQKFGPEPHFVKVNVSDLRGETSSFVIEMASTREMPHAVYHFLQMVDQNLWNGLALMLNGGTTPENFNHWMATPMKMDLRHGQHSWEGARFQLANLTHMAFTEHSMDYPPPGKFQYSVAFSGHPGGPSFYIRLDSDSAEEHITDIHRQSSSFGIVVEGIDVLQRYMSSTKRDEPIHGGESRHSTHMELLTIDSMEIVRNDNGAYVTRVE